VIVIDSSALLAIILYEPDARRYADAIIDSEARSVSDFALFESRVVLHKRIGEVGSARLSALLRESRMTTVAFDEPQSNLAFDAAGARATAPPASISATVFRTPSPKASTRPCYTRERTSRAPMCGARSDGRYFFSSNLSAAPFMQ
jgi:hypothetical protein